MGIRTHLNNTIIRGQLREPITTISREKFVVEDNQREKQLLEIVESEFRRENNGKPSTIKMKMNGNIEVKYDDEYL